MQLREKQKMLAMKSDHETFSHLFKESNLQATDANLLSDLDTLGLNLKDISNDTKSFQARDRKKMAAIHQLIDRLQKEDTDQSDHVP